MMIKRLLLAGLLLLNALPLAAQDSADTEITGLNNPRLLHYGPDGALYIAEAGIAGEFEAESELGPVRYGPTARVLRVAPGATEAEVVLDGLISSVGFNNYLGVNSVLATGDGWWLALGNGPQINGVHTNGALRLDAEGDEVRFIDFAVIEAELNPDNDFVSANPIDIAIAEDGTTYILDASGNALYSLSGDGEPALFHVWEDLPVPTAIDIGPEGDIFVSFLSAFPFPTGAARVEQWSPSGELVATYDGLTGVTDVLVADDGTVYAVEMSTRFGDFGWEPNMGRVVALSADGVSVVAEGLNYPYGIALSPDGLLAVSVNSAFVEPGEGSILWLDPSSASAPAEVVPPVETEEANS